MRAIIFIVAVLSLFTACKKNSIGNNMANAEFTFGTSFNFCSGDCAHFYALQDGKLYPDALTGQYGGTLAFKTTTLPNDKYLLAKQLLDSFPAFLLNNADTTFGCPDCADGGAIHIWRTINGSKKFWNIDYQDAGVPVEILPYITKLKTVLGQL